MITFIHFVTLPINLTFIMSMVAYLIMTVYIGPQFVHILSPLDEMRLFSFQRFFFPVSTITNTFFQLLQNVFIATTNIYL